MWRAALTISEFDHLVLTKKEKVTGFSFHVNYTNEGHYIFITIEDFLGLDNITLTCCIE